MILTMTIYLSVSQKFETTLSSRAKTKTSEVKQSRRATKTPNCQEIARGTRSGSEKTRLGERSITRFATVKISRLTLRSDDTCTIFVGEKQTPFVVLRDAVGQCDFLADRVQFTEELKSHIYLDDGIRDKEFMPIGEYLAKGEFAPRLIDKGTHQRLENVVLQEEKDEAAECITKVYLAASKVQFGALQLLCVDKLKVLYPLSSRSLLIVVTVITRAESWGCDAEDEIIGWLVDHVAERFWDMVAHEGLTLTRVMSYNEELRQSVLAKLAEAGRRELDAD